MTAVILSTLVLFLAFRLGARWEKARLKRVYQRRGGEALYRQFFPDPAD